MTTPYVYELIDRKTEKWYVGSRTAKNCKPEDLGVSYFTSSKIVSLIFKDNPDRFIKKILVISDVDYVVKVESGILKLRDAKNDIHSYNAWNGDGKFNAKKAANITVKTKVGVHARSAKKKIEDARKGGLIGGKVTKSRKVGIFARTLEEMQAAGRHVGKTQNVEIKRSNGKKAGTWAAINKVGFCGMTTEQRRQNGLKTAGKRFECLECGMVSTAGGIAIHQSVSSHKGRKNVN